MRKKNERFKEIDILRGTAVLGMIFAHVFFFRSGPNKMFAVSELINIFNTYSFTAFLFCFSAALYLSVLKKKSIPIKEIIKRLFILISAYYLLASGSYLYQLVTTSKPVLLHKLSEIYLFLSLPTFTEYLMPFILFTIIAYLINLSGLWNKLKYFFSPNRIVITIFFSFIIHITGNILSTYIHLHSHYGRLLSAHLWGSSDFFRFPLLQYAPVVVTGIFIGYMFDNYYKDKEGTLSKTIIILGYIFILTNMALDYSFKIFYNKISLPFINTMIRFPPSLSFVTTSLGYCLIALAVIYHVKIPNFIKEILAFLGKYAIFILVFHLLVIFLIESFKVPQTNNILSVFLLYIGIVVFFIIFTKVVNLIKIRFHTS